MAYDGGGNFSIINTFVYDTVISETEVNANFSDIATGLSTAITKDGQTTITANIPMSNYKLTGLGAGTAATDAATLGQVQAGDYKYDACGGTKNALTLSPSPAITAYAAGQEFIGVIGGTASDAAVTLAVSGLTTKSVQIDGSALDATTFLEANKIYSFLYDGTQFQATRLSKDTQNLASGSVGTDAIADNAVTLDKIASGTAGNLITYDAFGDPSYVSTGTSGQVLTSNGAGAAPTMQDAAGGGKVVAHSYSEKTTYQSISSTISLDDTIPQNTEGVEILTVSHTPASASNILEIDVQVHFSASSTDTCVFPLFQDSTADALATAAAQAPTTDEMNCISYTHRMTAGTTSSTTFKIRGANVAFTPLTINGTVSPASRRFGGTLKTFIKITELEP